MWIRFALLIYLWLIPSISSNSAQEATWFCQHPLAGIENLAVKIQRLHENPRPGEYPPVAAREEWSMIFDKVMTRTDLFFDQCLSKDIPLQDQLESRIPLAFEALDVLGEKEVRLELPSFSFAIWDTLVDVNLDGNAELAITLDVRAPFGGLAFSRTQAHLYYLDEGWKKVSLWPLPDFEHETVGPFTPISGAFYMFDQVDSLGRSYMTMRMAPTGGDPYIDGLIVVRWENWTPEVVLVETEHCTVPFGILPWTVGEQGQLIIPVTSSVPQQGCTVIQTDELIIEDAMMYPPSEDQQN